MLMRVSIGIHLNDIDEAIATYELMSKKFFTLKNLPTSQRGRLQFFINIRFSNIVFGLKPIEYWNI